MKRKFDWIELALAVTDVGPLLLFIAAFVTAYKVGKLELVPLYSWFFVTLTSQELARLLRRVRAQPGLTRSDVELIGIHIILMASFVYNCLKIFTF